MIPEAVDRSPTSVPGELSLPGGRTLRFDRPLVMGVLNVTPDSFSDGGRYLDRQAATARALTMVEEGADIIDIGGESSRPGAAPVPPEEEQARVLPVIEAVRSRSAVPISIDTYRRTTAEKALAAGADIINDISALRFDPELAPLAAERGVPIILMHMQGTPRDMQKNPHYDNCIEEIAGFFDERLAFCDHHGIARDRLILDPGIGFGKRLRDNLEILARLAEFRRFGRPILTGTSRKSFIGMVHDSGRPAEERIGGSIASAVIAVQHGADIVRVHDVAATVEALKVMRAIQKAR